jgi:hypothetical protein
VLKALGDGADRDIRIVEGVSWAAGRYPLVSAEFYVWPLAPAGLRTPTAA